MGREKGRREVTCLPFFAGADAHIHPERMGMECGAMKGIAPYGKRGT